MSRALCLVALFLFSGWACSKAPIEEEPVVRPVKSIVVGGLSAGDGRSYPGTVKAANEVNLSFRVAGPLVEFPVKRGQDVQEGDLLARLDARDYRTNLAKAKAQFRRADEEYKRTQELYIRGYISQSELDLRRSERDVAKAQLADATAALADTELRAPFDGRITDKFVDTFEDVQAKQPIVRLVDLSTLEIVINIPENDLALGGGTPTIEEAAKHLTASVEFTAFPEKRIPVTLQEAELEADPKTQTFMLKFLLSNPERMNILPGMTSTVYVKAGEKLIPTGSGSFWVPLHAVFADDQGNQFVWVINEETNIVHKRPVRVGTMQASSIEVVTGLDPGERIATAGIHQLEDGMQVSLME